MAVRFSLLLGVLVFICISQVSPKRYSEEEFGMKMGDVDGEAVVAMRGRNRRVMQNIDCGWECKRRCEAHSRPNVCTRACGTCCARCNCVPPGTSGNREMCGTCYTTMTTHGNKTKCP